MSIARLRQVAALEKQLGPVIEEMRREALYKLRETAGHAAAVAFIIKYGSPQIEEPLVRACKRVERSEAWRENCSDTPVLGSCEYKFPRFAGDYARDALRHGLIRFFAGRDEKDKLNRIFEKAPPWLIWYTFSDYTARNLGLRLPDLKSVSRFWRFRAEIEGCEFYIPKRAFKPEPWPHGVIEEPVARPRLLNFDWPALSSKQELAEIPAAALAKFR